MDWEAAIETNREALKRILSALVAMAGLADGGRAQLPRILHRTVLRLLRPAESAARRLVIVAARGMIAEPPTPRALKQRSAFIRNGHGTGIVMPRGFRLTPVRKPPPRLALPLFDTLPRFAANRPVRGRTSASGVPRISGFGFGTPSLILSLSKDPAIRRPIRPAPTPNDPIPAERLLLRFQAIGRALDDLPSEALRFARWQARRDAAAQERRREQAARDPAPPPPRRFQRLTPLRSGRPPGGLVRPTHEVHDVLAILHGLAVWALERPNTS